MQFIGTISYSLYLSHHLLLTWLSKAALPDIPGPLVLIGWVTAALALATVMHYLIERPVIAAARRISSFVTDARSSVQVAPYQTSASDEAH